MRDAGLVTHRRAPRPRGRPRDEWAIAPTARPGGEPRHAYGALAVWLARSIPATPARLREVEATGCEIGQQLASRTTVRPERAIGDLLTAPAAKSTSTASRRHPTNRHRVARSEVVRRVDLANRREQPLVLGHAL